MARNLSAKLRRRLLVTIVFTLFLLGLISLALGVTNPTVAIVALVSVLSLALFFHLVFPGSDFFSAVFANSIGIYACIFVFFVEENFPDTYVVVQAVAFVMPLLGFLAGALWHRRDITNAVVGKKEEVEHDFLRAAAFLSPLTLVAAASFVIPIREAGVVPQSVALMSAMVVVSVTALFAANQITAFLLDTAILSEHFFANAARLVKPAFAFFTCYSLIVLVFGCLYTILDRYAPPPNFMIGGAVREMSFGEGLYLSVVTLSTVGYGDVIAQSAIARILVGLEIFAGVVLLLFGFQAIISSGRKSD